jgi:isopentenyldiphosphate isomerase
MEYKRITVVDEQDNLIGYFSYDEAIEKKMIRRASVVLIFDEMGRILVQKRSTHISNPLLLDKSTAGHVDEGETYHDAAIREMHEELGLQNFEITLVLESCRMENFFYTLYKTTIPSDTVINFDPHEVDSIEWMTIQELEQKMLHSPELFRTSFTKLWAMLRAKLIP